MTPNDLIDLSGRRNRCSYALFIAMWALSMLCCQQGAAALDAFLNQEIGFLAVPLMFTIVLLQVTLIVGAILGTAFFVNVSAQRARDIGWHPMTAIAALFVAGAIVLLLVPGAKGANKFGPEPNSVAVAYPQGHS